MVFGFPQVLCDPVLFTSYELFLLVYYFLLQVERSLVLIVKTWGWKQLPCQRQWMLSLTMLYPTYNAPWKIMVLSQDKISSPTPAWNVQWPWRRLRSEHFLADLVSRVPFWDKITMYFSDFFYDLSADSAGTFATGPFYDYMRFSWMIFHLVNCFSNT